MVSFWPWRGDASSPASFEKTLSALSAMIAKTQVRLDSLRSRSRRIKGLWTVYLIIAYLVYAIVALLVIGRKSMGPLEWSGFAGGPFVIYFVRRLISAYYNFRIDNTTSYLEDQQQERANTIQKLKDATRYDTTLELLAKYGGENRPGSAKESEDKESISGLDGQDQRPPSAMGIPGRTNMVPPPTANIQRGSRSSTPAQPLMQHPVSLEPTAEFAPNAFSGHISAPAPQPVNMQYQAQSDGPHWYDRVLDLLLGEDEMAPRNRIALVCQQCRLVNGQAPPGTKSLSELGMWKCMGCGSMNGEMDEGKKIIRELMEEKASQVQEEQSEGSDEMVEVGREDIVEAEASGKAKSGGARKRKGKGGK